MIPVQEQSVLLKVDDITVKIAYTKQGPSDGVPLLFIHGFGSSRQPFVHSIFPKLPPFVQAIALDLPGFGESNSENNAHISYSISFLVKTIGTFLDALELSKANFYGMSMGGTASLCFAAQFPQRVNSLIIQGAPLHKSDRGALKLFIFMPWLAILRMISPYLAARWVQSLYRRSDFERIAGTYPEYLKVMAEEIKQLEFSAAMSYGYDLIKSDRGHCAEKISCPTLLIDGDSVEVPYLNTLETLNKYLPDASIYRVRNAGHLATFVAPDEIARILVQFLSKHNEPSYEQFYHHEK